MNLTLQVQGRRPGDGYHELESVVAFADIADELEYDPEGPLDLVVQGPQAQACGALADNLVLKAARQFAEAAGQTVTGRFTLTKILPAAAGLGGGSADAAAALRLLARAHGLSNDDALRAAARQVGADVPVCLDPRPRVMRGIGELLSEPLSLPPLAAVLVNPGVAVPTGDVFKALDAGPVRGTPALAQVPYERAALIAFLTRGRNDLEAPAIRVQPVIAEVLATLRATGARLVRMSGSGATCFAIYDDVAQAEAGARALGESQPKWWVRATTLG